MEITRSVDGKWLVYNSAIPTEFDTKVQAEWFEISGQSLSAIDAALALGGHMAKIDTAKAIVSAVKTLTTATDLALDLEAEYFDVGTFIDEDVAALGITASDLASCITLLQQITALMTGQVTSPSMYRSTINKVRRIVV